jgi:branched-chain amino acid aminotransferase
MLNPEGNVAECTGDNVFVVNGGRVSTPPLSAGALRGITRGVVMDLACEAGLEVDEPNLARYDLYNANECFITGTAAEIVPIVKIDGRVVGNGRPGKVSRMLIGNYRALTQASGEPI